MLGEAPLAMDAPTIILHAARIAEMVSTGGLPTIFPRDSAQRGPMLANGACLPRHFRA